MVGDDARVYVSQLLAVKRPLPSFVMIAAHNNSERRPVNVGAFTNLSKPFLALNNNQMLRLTVCSGRSNMGSL